MTSLPSPAFDADPREMSRRSLWAGRTVALLGILIVALSLRLLTGCLSPIYGLVQQDMALPDMAIAILGALAPFGFAIASFLAPKLGRKIGIEWGLILAMTLIVLSHVVRAVAPEWGTLAVATGVGLIGTGIGNVLLPPAVKKYFPDRIALVTTAYVSLLAVSSAIAPLVAHPMSEAIGWREGFMVWAAITVISVIPWLVEVRLARGRVTDGETLVVAKSTLKLHKSPTAIALALMLAISSINGYVVFSWLPPLMMGMSGVNATQAGLLLSLFGVMGLPVSLLTPLLAAKVKRTDIFLYVSCALFLVAYGGLILWPQIPLLWGILIGAGPIIFPLTLVLINLRTRSTAASMQLSGFVQVWAYAIATLGPLTVGVIREATHSWPAVLIFLMAVSFCLVFLAPVLGRGRFVEDEVGG